MVLFSLQRLIKNEDFLIDNHGEAWGVCEIENKRAVRPLGFIALSA